jgi:hypothetical protein
VLLQARVQDCSLLPEARIGILGPEFDGTRQRLFGADGVPAPQQDFA